MVLAGQYLERAVTVKSGELSLDALYHRGQFAPACVLASPHPALGGSMTAPVIAELAWALTRAGHATLRFDYRGVGASQGQTRHPPGSLRIGALDDELLDFFAAADQLRATARSRTADSDSEADDPERPEPPGGLCAVGYSFGAAVVLAAAPDARIARIILVAPPTALADFSALRTLDKPALLVCAHHDPLCDRALLRPGPQGLVEVIPHSDHSFRRGLTELGKLCAAWLRGDRPEASARASADEDEPSPVRELDLDPGDEAPLELDTD
jgi:alpha/beta superfamily hydrolase